MGEVGIPNKRYLIKVLEPELNEFSRNNLRSMLSVAKTICCHGDKKQLSYSVMIIRYCAIGQIRNVLFERKICRFFPCLTSIFP